MIRKSDLGLRIGITMLILCAAMVLTALPAAAYYNADKPLVTYDQGTITGGMNYTIGNSTYSPKLLNYNSTTGTNDSYLVELAPKTATGASTVKARLYVYWTWAFNNTSSGGLYDTGIEPTITVTLNDTVISPETRYVDWKNNAAAGLTSVSYNYPSGTYAYDVTNYINASNNGQIYYVNVTNTKPYNGNDGTTTGDDTESLNIQAIGLLTLYNQTDGDEQKYWVDEGCDLTECAYKNTTGTWTYNTPTDSALTPDDCVALANFTGVTINEGDSANLITAVPASSASKDGIRAATSYNRLYVNYFFNYPTWQGIKYWDGVWDGYPRYDGNFSVATTDVTDNLLNGTNYIGFQNGNYDMLPNYNESQMQAANAFLLITPND